MNILTFDIEDWFHILDNPDTKGIAEWSKFESRLAQNMDTIFKILDDHQQKATFFVVGWIAEKHPDQVKRIIENGHEIGSHTHLHQLVYEQSPADFGQDLQKSIGILGDIAGNKIKYFRAPGFSITSNTPWAFEALLKNGIEIDSSVFPASRSHGGFEQFGTAKPAIIACQGMQLKEFPINTHRLFGKDIIFSGGGYFRLFPYSAIQKFTEKSPYVMTYFHPRDFDPQQPMVPGLSAVRKFKSYYGLKQTEVKLRKWVNNFEFMDLAKANEKVNWTDAPVIDITSK
ncbi:MAG: polysaccharide deacetylase family protein [Crocinitomicaceae bacterium]|nr:polysaccharide deacetylase family protein [Crocinitomicaceae bacterium]